MSAPSTKLRSVGESAAAAAWPSLLALRHFLARTDRTSGPVALHRSARDWRFSEDAEAIPDEAEEVLLIALAEAETLPDPDAPVVAHFRFERFLSRECPIVPVRGALDEEAESFLRFYLPSLLGGYLARLRGDVFVLAHLAQTLDGRIACRNGQSQWIGNQANLHHAHRLRALHDAVVVGGRTVELDDPRLTVRHVQGEDPTRVVLNASASVLRSERRHRIFESPGSLVLCSTTAARGLPLNGRHAGIEVVALELVPGREDGLFPPDLVRGALAERGLHSIFVEGGGRTLSSFLQHGAIDILQLHVAPVVLGSGRAGLRLPEVTSIDSGRRMKTEHFALDGEVLLECRDLAREETESS